MLNGYSIIDADSHVVEPPSMWAEYLEPEFKQFAPSADMKIKGEDIKNQWYKPDTYYQVLCVEHSPEEEGKGQNISTSILARMRNLPSLGTHELPGFGSFELDEETIEKLKNFPRKGDDNRLSSYLPSSGVFFPEGFIKTISIDDFDNCDDKHKQTELGNFYPSIRVILQSRKLSQLVARTWWTYLEAKKNDNDNWEKFINGDWDNIDDVDILDGLIAREIFLFGGGASPNKIEDEKIYLPLKPKEIPTKARFLILPSSKCWQGISLSLLLAGQAYYKRGDKYHQICQPIFSTGEILFKYSLKVDWNRFNGDIKEIFISYEKPWIAYNAVLPYPPIPANADQENIKNWAEADDDVGEFPFYKKDEDGQYLVDVDYFRPPYPYIPVTCS